MTGYVITVDFAIKPESYDQFLTLVRDNAAHSMHSERGCRRFDVCVPEDGSSRVFLYEIYEDEAALKAHLQTTHFKSFAAATAQMVRERTIIAMKLLEPL